MDYIRNLSREEKIILCKMITGGNFRELFKKNEREFSKIQTGFRAKTLSDTHALSIKVASLIQGNMNPGMKCSLFIRTFEDLYLLEGPFGLWGL